MEEASNNQFFKKRWVQNTALVLVGVIGVYGLIYMDVVSRAKEAYLEGEKYMSWHEDPEKKKAALDAKFKEDKAELDALLKDQEISENAYRERLDSLEFDRRFHMNESSLKYAYQWYKDTFELFSPPESKWVKMARQKAPEVLELWKEELRAKKIPIEDYMFE